MSSASANTVETISAADGQQCVRIFLVLLHSLVDRSYGSDESGMIQDIVETKRQPKHVYVVPHVAWSVLRFTQRTQRVIFKSVRSECNNQFKHLGSVCLRIACVQVIN